jgi:hypothetical protein
MFSTGTMAHGCPGLVAAGAPLLIAVRAAVPLWPRGQTCAARDRHAGAG